MIEQISANPKGRGGFKKVRAAIPAVGQLASVMHEARRHTFAAIRTLLKLIDAHGGIRVGQAERWVLS
jgi:hypothetical protein